jgi:hypothetical protein
MLVAANSCAEDLLVRRMWLVEIAPCRPQTEAVMLKANNKIQHTFGDQVADAARVVVSALELVRG